MKWKSHPRCDVCNQKLGQRFQEFGPYQWLCGKLSGGVPLTHIMRTNPGKYLVGLLASTLVLLWWVGWRYWVQFFLIAFVWLLSGHVWW